MPRAPQTDSSAVFLETTAPMLWSTGCDSFVLALLSVSHTLGFPSSYRYLKGVSATAFRLIFARDWTRYAPDALQGVDPTRMAYAALGLRADTLVIDPADGPARTDLMAVIRARIGAGYPLLGLGMMGWEDWGLIAGYSMDGEGLLCRTPHTPDLSEARNWPWTVQVIYPGGPVTSRKSAVLRSVRAALEQFETETYGAYWSGRAAYLAWISGLQDEASYAPFEAGAATDYTGRMDDLLAAESANLQADRPLDCAYLERAHVNAWRLKSLVDARQAAAHYLSEASALFRSEAGVRLSAAGRDYEEVVQLLEMARPFAPSETQLGQQPWSQRLRDKQAALLQQALAAEESAVQAMRAALVRMV